MAQEAHGTHVVHIHIDKQEYQSPSPTTGAALYQLAKIADGLQLLKKGHAHDEDSAVANDGAVVHLKNGDHFYSATPKPTETMIFVNTDPVNWSRPQISYDELVKLAFPSGPVGGNVLYSITWTKPDGQEGTLLPGQQIKVVNRMKFDVRNTDKS